LAAQLFKQLFNVLGPYAFEISIGLLLVLWFYFFIKYHILRLVPVSRQLDRFCRFLNELDNAAENNEQKINDYIHNNKTKSFLSYAWEDYTANKSVQPDVLLYFDENTLLDEPASRSRAASVPSLIMSIGLLASFACLYAGLGDLSKAFSGQASSLPVVGGVILLAVLTIALSAVYSSLDKSLFDKTEAVVYEIHKFLSRKLVSAQENNQMDRIAISIDSMTDSLAAYAQYTADIQRGGMNQLVDSFLSSLNSEMNGQLAAFGKSLESLSAAHSKSAAQTETFIGELVKGTENQQFVNQAAEHIISSIAQYQEQISDSSQSLASSLQDLHKLSDTLSGIVGFNREAMEAIKQERESLTGEYAKYIQGIQDMIQRYQKDTSIELERVMVKFADVSGKTFSRLEGSVMKSMDVWTNSNKSMLQNMEEQSRSLVSVSREIALRLNELNAGLKENMKAFTETVEGGTVKTLTEFDNSLGEITQRLSQTITEIRDSIDDLPVVIESLKQHVS
jgi:ABC-type transporter Mla subunit MlaD